MPTPLLSMPYAYRSLADISTYGLASEQLIAWLAQEITTNKNLQLPKSAQISARDCLCHDYMLTAFEFGLIKNFADFEFYNSLVCHNVTKLNSSFEFNDAYKALFKLLKHRHFSRQEISDYFAEWEPVSVEEKFKCFSSDLVHSFEYLRHFNPLLKSLFTPYRVRTTPIQQRRGMLKFVLEQDSQRLIQTKLFDAQWLVGHHIYFHASLVKFLITPRGEAVWRELRTQFSDATLISWARTDNEVFFLQSTTFMQLVETGWIHNNEKLSISDKNSDTDALTELTRYVYKLKSEIDHCRKLNPILAMIPALPAQAMLTSKSLTSLRQKLDHYLVTLMSKTRVQIQPYHSFSEFKFLIKRIYQFSENLLRLSPNGRVDAEQHLPKQSPCYLLTGYDDFAIKRTLVAKLIYLASVDYADWQMNHKIKCGFFCNRFRKTNFCEAFNDLWSKVTTAANKADLVDAVHQFVHHHPQTDRHAPISFLLNSFKENSGACKLFDLQLNLQLNYHDDGQHAIRKQVVRQFLLAHLNNQKVQHARHPIAISK